MKTKWLFMLSAAAMVAIAVSAAQADTNNLVGGDITNAAGWDNGLPTGANPGFIAVDGIITDTTFGYGADTVITQTAGAIVGSGTNGFNWGNFNGTNGGGTWNMSGGSIIVRYFLPNDRNSGGNTTFNISGGTITLNGSGNGHLGAANGGHLNISGSAVLNATLATAGSSDTGIYDIATGWSGYWTYGIYTGDDWKNFVVAHVTVDDAAVDAATFDKLFIVNDNGKTLTMRNMDPHPANGETVSAANPLTLSWKNMDPNSPGDDVYVDVWFGTEPNELDPSYDMTKIVTAGKNTTTVQVDASIAGTYYWRVNSYIYGADHINEPNMIEGSLWSFYAVDDAPPSVVIDTPDMITWSGQAVQLDATVTDDGVSALTYLWTADAPDGVVFTPSASVEDPTVTITKDAPTGDATTVTVTLTVNDEGNPTTFVDDSMTIDVYDDACKAALGTGLTIDQTDFDANCITDIKDLAVMLAKWLFDYKATAPVSKP